MPLISVIVPVYNSESYIHKCVDSIINQTYKKMEIILVDDGSTDESPQICDEYAKKDDRIKVIHKNNGGQSSARNLGLDVCHGEYIGFVDSDDWVSPYMYENLLSLIKNDEMISVIGMQEVTETGTVIRTRITENIVLDAKDLLSDILLHRAGTSICTKLFPKSVIGNIRFAEDRLNEDLLFLISVIDNVNSVSYHSSIGYFYLNRRGSTSRIFGKAVHDMIDNSKRVRKHVDEKYPILSKEAEHFEIYQHMSFLLCCPYNYDRKSDPLYREVLSYVRKHVFAGIGNQYFTFKDKLKLISVSLCPRLISLLLEKKNKNDKK